MASPIELASSRAVHMITGRLLASKCSRTARRTSSPESFGIIQSSRMRSGGDVETSEIALTPSVSVCVSKPARVRLRERMMQLSSTSSTMTMRPLISFLGWAKAVG